MAKTYNCNECGKVIIFDNDVLGKNGRPRPLNEDHSIHMHIKKPQVVGGEQVQGNFYEEKKQEREEYWKQRDAIFEERFKITQEHWVVQQNLLIKISSGIDRLVDWLQLNNKTPSETKKKITELQEEKEGLAAIINLKEDTIAELNSALAKTSFKPANEV